MNSLKPKWKDMNTWISSEVTASYFGRGILWCVLRLPCLKMVWESTTILCSLYSIAPFGAFEAKPAWKHTTFGKSRYPNCNGRCKIISSGFRKSHNNVSAIFTSLFSIIFLHRKEKLECMKWLICEKWLVKKCNFTWQMQSLPQRLKSSFKKIMKDPKEASRVMKNFKKKKLDFSLLLPNHAFEIAKFFQMYIYTNTLQCWKYVQLHNIFATKNLQHYISALANATHIYLKCFVVDNKQPVSKMLLGKKIYRDFLQYPWIVLENAPLVFAFTTWIVLGFIFYPTDIVLVYGQRFGESYFS